MSIDKFQGQRFKHSEGLTKNVIFTSRNGNTLCLRYLNQRWWLKHDNKTSFQWRCCYHEYDEIEDKYIPCPNKIKTTKDLKALCIIEDPSDFCEHDETLNEEKWRKFQAIKQISFYAQTLKARNSYNKYILLNPQNATMFHSFYEVKSRLYREGSTIHPSLPKSRKEITAILSTSMYSKNYWGFYKTLHTNDNHHYTECKIYSRYYSRKRKRIKDKQELEEKKIIMMIKNILQ